jgi:RNA recognition motif-containing protein
MEHPKFRYHRLVDSCPPGAAQASGEDPMKLYVENLPEHTSVEDLTDLFTPYGDVTSARILSGYHDGRARGFGYVEMLKQNAEIAISELNGRRIDFMVLRVGEAKS